MIAQSLRLISAVPKHPFRWCLCILESMGGEKMADRSLQKLGIVPLVWIILASAVSSLAAPPGAHRPIESEPTPCMLYDGEVDAFITVEGCTEPRVTGHSQGNHRLDCTVIRPWDGSGASMDTYPVIVWANGWGWNDNAGETTTIGYKPGLIEWAINGPYVVVAANQWSVQESDILECLKWIIDQNAVEGSDYFGKINIQKIGIAGHSQGGGATIKAGGDGTQSGLSITATIAMNPYGPAWVNPGDQDGPMLILGGAKDTTTPPESYQAVWEAVAVNGIGGINAVLIDGTHNSEAWGVDPYPDGETLDNEGAAKINFMAYQEITEFWWDYFLNENTDSLENLEDAFDKNPWKTEWSPDWLQR
jgi:hypothetical protein